MIHGGVCATKQMNSFFWRNLLILSVPGSSLSFLRASGGLSVLPAGFVPYFLGVEALNESSCQSVLGGLVTASRPAAQRWGGRMGGLGSSQFSLWKSQLLPRRNPSFVPICPATGGRAGRAIPIPICSATGGGAGRADNCVLFLGLELGVGKSLECPDLVLYP